jgi:hypothetical protein
LPNTTYYYKAWSILTGITYSTGVTSNATTFCSQSALPFTESFSGTSLPNCWQNNDNQGNGQVWQFGTTTGSPAPALTGNYAYLNSDDYGSGNSQNADLISPILNLTSFKDIHLQFNHYFKAYSGSSGTLSYSINNGTWTTIAAFSITSATNPVAFNQVIAAVAGQSNVKFKWNYTGTWGYYWAIDDIQITGTQVSTWTGITDSDWNKPGNWLAQAVPASTDNISVPSAGITHFPVISTAGIQCANLEISSGAVLTVASTGTLDVTGTLTNSAGSTGLVVESGGSLIHSTASVPATIKRSIGIWGPLASQGWHMLASPVAAQAFQPEFVPATPTASEDFYLWKESTNEWVNSKAGPDLGPWTFNTSDFGSTFEPGRGYLVAYGAAVTKNFTGIINSANVRDSLVNTDGTGRQGWNLCGNPFASALTWNVEIWLPGNTHVGGVAKILISSTGAYDDITGGELIPALNGFFVHTDADTVLTIPASSRVHGGTWYKSGNDIKKIILTASDLEGQTAQRCQIVINPEASTGFDRLYDGESARLYAPAFYTIANGYHLSTNAVPAISNETVISLGFGKNAGSTYQIEASGADLPEMDAFMLDKKTNIRQNLSLEPVYRFNAADGDAEDRFVLYFGTVGMEEPEKTKQDIYSYGHNLFVRNAGNAILEIYNVAGQKIMHEQIHNSALYTTALLVPTGYYIVRLTNSGNVKNTKILIH